MSKKLYMQGYSSKKPAKRKQHFNHYFRHALKKMVMFGSAESIESEMLNGTGQYQDNINL